MGWSHGSANRLAVTEIPFDGMRVRAGVNKASSEVNRLALVNRLVRSGFNSRGDVIHGNCCGSRIVQE